LRGLFRTCSILLIFGLLASPSLSSVSVRIKDVVQFEGLRDNQLVGVGLVVGLSGTGDKSPAALRMARNVMGHFGLNVSERDLKSRNVAVVTVTANLPPFARPGQRIDVQVSSMGDAKSLQGGVLLQTPLKAADGNVYAVAQGSVLVGGFSVGGEAAAVQVNVPTVGRIPGGAIVERAVPGGLAPEGVLRLSLRNPDFTTAHRIASVINAAVGSVARAVDPSTVEVLVPSQFGRDLVGFVARIEGLELKADAPARVVVNEATGTVVMGENVRISRVAIAHGNLTLRVSERPEVVQPQPLGGGQTAVVPRTEVGALEQQGRVVELSESATVGDVVRALNAVGATPRDIISILQAMKSAGALQAELVVM